MPKNSILIVTVINLQEIKSFLVKKSKEIKRLPEVNAPVTPLQPPLLLV